MVLEYGHHHPHDDPSFTPSARLKKTQTGTECRTRLQWLWGTVTKGREEYARRKAIIEPVFGQIKECLGFRKFLLRSLEKMKGEWKLVCVVHNLLKLFRSGAPVTVIARVKTGQ